MRGFRLFLFLLLLAGAVACTNRRTVEPIVVWFTLSSDQAGPVQAAALEFQEKSSIPVRLELKTGQEIEAWLVSDPQDEPRPDLVSLEAGRLPLFVARVQSLEPRMKKWAEAPRFNNPVWAIGIFSNQVFFLPWHLSWSAMICNGSVLPAPPQTWEDLLEIGRDHPGQIGLRGLRPEDLAEELVPLIWQFGGDPFYLTNPGTRQAFDFLSRLAPFLSLSTRSFDDQSILEAQRAGEIILHFNRLPAAQTLGRQQSLPVPNYTAALPSGPGAQVGLLQGSFLGIPKSASHPEEAFRFIQFLLQPANQARFFEELGWLTPPPMAGILRGFDRERYQGYLKMAAALRVLPAQEHLPEIQAIWARAFDQVVNQGLPAEDVLIQLEPEMQRWRR